jgi:hypothetical protein
LNLPRTKVIRGNRKKRYNELKRGEYKGQSNELNGSNFEFAVKRAHRDKLSKKKKIVLLNFSEGA